VYPIPAVVVVTGVSPLTGAVTPAIAAIEIDETLGVGEGEGEGAAATGTGGVAVVIDVELSDSGEAPASLFAISVNV
jgi:carbon monoxide dehydrogenase subunit G